MQEASDTEGMNDEGLFCPLLEGLRQLYMINPGNFIEPETQTDSKLRQPADGVLQS